MAVLDTPPEAGFDALTRLAAKVCATPIALVSTVCVLDYEGARRGVHDIFGESLV